MRRRSISTTGITPIQEAVIGGTVGCDLAPANIRRGNRSTGKGARKTGIRIDRINGIRESLVVIKIVKRKRNVVRLKRRLKAVANRSYEGIGDSRGSDAERARLLVLGIGILEKSLIGRHSIGTETSIGYIVPKVVALDGSGDESAAEGSGEETAESHIGTSAEHTEPGDEDGERGTDGVGIAPRGDQEIEGEQKREESAKDLAEEQAKRGREAQ